jgi:hypothetical protein
MGIMGIQGGTKYLIAKAILLWHSFINKKEYTRA